MPFLKLCVRSQNPWRDDLNEYFANPAPACMPSEVEREAALDDLTMTVGPALVRNSAGIMSSSTWRVTK